MSIFSRLTSRRPFGDRGSRRGSNKRRTRFAPACDGLEVRALLSNIVVSNTDDSGAGSLRQALLSAPGGATIVFANNLKGQTIALTSGVLSVNQSVKIDGPGASELAVSGGGLSQVFSVAAGANVTISGLTVTDGLSNTGEFGVADGGGIVNAGNLTLQNTVVAGNQAIATSAAGGGIYNTGTLTLDHSQVINNVVDSEVIAGTGGGIENSTGGTLLITQSVVSDNQVITSTSLFVQGGGIDNQVGATATIASSTLEGNQAIGGPGIFDDGGWGIGGAINDAGVLSISGSTLSGNQAIGADDAGFAGLAEGGAIAALSSTVLNGVPQVATLAMTNSVIENNQAVGGATAGTGFISEAGEADGGAMDVSSDSSVTLVGCTFLNNQALGGAGGGGTAFGGAIHSGSTFVFSISNSTFNGNEAVGGDGPSVSNPNTFITEGASGFGGAIYSTLDPLVVTNTTFKNNLAKGGNAACGGAVQRRRPGEWGRLNYNSPSSMSSASLVGCTLTGNQAVGGTGEGGGEGDAQGGAIILEGGVVPGVTVLSITGTAIVNNVAIAGNDPTSENAGSAAGGGIDNSSTSITLLNSLVSGNQAIGAASSSPFGAGDAFGGGIDDGEGAVSITNTPIVGNSAIGGAGISSTTAQGGSGGGASGGGIYAFGDTVSLTNSPVSGNKAAGGAGGSSGGGQDGGAGGVAVGGGIYTTGTLGFSIVNGQFVETDLFSSVTATNSSFLGNLAIGGPGAVGNGAGIGGAGGAATGGAVYGDIGSDVSVSGALVSLNSAIGGAGGAGSAAGDGGSGGDAQGGAFYVNGPSTNPFDPLPGATLSLSNVVVTLNSAIGGGAGHDAPAGSAGQGMGGGIYVVTGGTATLLDTLVFLNFASTSDSNISGTVSS